MTEMNANEYARILNDYLNPGEFKFGTTKAQFDKGRNHEVCGMNIEGYRIDIVTHFNLVKG